MTVLDVLRGRGSVTVNTDYGDWVLPDGTWDERRMDQLLVDRRDIVIAGTVSNQGGFHDRFEHVVLLSAPLEVLLGGVGTRTNNPYGREPRSADTATTSCRLRWARASGSWPQNASRTSPRLGGEQPFTWPVATRTASALPR
jgi:hypothetical protein